MNESGGGGGGDTYNRSKNDLCSNCVDAIYICSEPCETVILPYTRSYNYLQEHHCKNKLLLERKEEWQKEYKVITRYNLIKLYLFCGVKQYWVDRVVERVIHDLVLECTQLDESTLSLQENDKELSWEINKEGLKQQTECDKSRNDDTNTKFILVMHDKLFSSVCARVLRMFLRGQFITLYSLYRWEAAQQVTLHKQLPLIILCGGTSGSGKSTLAALIASQLHISLIVSTDTIRQVLRTEYAHKSKSNNTDYNDKNKRAEKIHKILQLSSYDPIETNCTSSVCNEYCKLETWSVKVKERVEQHYFEQCSYILPVLHKVIARNVEAGNSMVIEGVHLHPRYMAQVQEAITNFNNNNNNNNNNNANKKQAICVAVLLRIAKEERHRERFAIRAKSMSLSPQVNKYVAKFDNIRIIQEILERQIEQIQGNETNNTSKLHQQQKRKQKHYQTCSCGKNFKNIVSSILSINNTNVDKSWMILHCKILSLLEEYKVAEHAKAKQSVVVVSNVKQDNTANYINKQIELEKEEEKEELRELEQYNDKSEYESCKVEEQFVYSNLSSKKALELLHERKLSKQRNKRKSVVESKTLQLLESERNYNKRFTLANTANRTISAPAHITLRCTSNDKITTNDDNKENSASEHSHSNNLECMTDACDDDDDKENCNLQIQCKSNNNKNNIVIGSSSKNTLLLRKPLARSHSQSLFMQSAQRCTRILCDELSSNVHMEETEIPSLTNSINGHVHLSLSSTSEK